MVRQLKESDLPACVSLYVAAYNDKSWGCSWKIDSAAKYLRELMDSPRFVGFIVCEEKEVVGALFCHERTCWEQDEIYLDELFIGPQYQRMGYGRELLMWLEGYIKERKLAGLTLMTCKRMPAYHFYESNGYKEAAGIAMMYKALEE